MVDQKCPECGDLLNRSAQYDGSPSNIKFELVWCVNQACKRFGVMLDPITLKPRSSESPSTHTLNGLPATATADLRLHDACPVRRLSGSRNELRGALILAPKEMRKLNHGRKDRSSLPAVSGNARAARGYFWGENT